MDLRLGFNLERLRKAANAKRLNALKNTASAIIQEQNAVYFANVKVAKIIDTNIILIILIILIFKYF